MSHEIMQIAVKAADGKQENTISLEIVYLAATCFQESWRDRLYQLHGKDWQAHNDRAEFDAAAEAFCRKLWVRLDRMLANVAQSK